MKNEKLEKVDPRGQNVKYNGKMLVFPDPISFMSTLQSIAKANQDCPEINEVKSFKNLKIISMVFTLYEIKLLEKLLPWRKKKALLKKTILN